MQSISKDIPTFSDVYVFSVTTFYFYTIHFNEASI